MQNMVQARLTGLTVDVYRNLNKRGMFSIRHKGKVIAHESTVYVQNVRFHVNIKAQQRIAAGENRSVHAWCKGTIIDPTKTVMPWGDFESGTWLEATYKPHVRGQFFTLSDGKAIAGADFVVFNDNRMFISGVLYV